MATIVAGAATHIPKGAWMRRGSGIPGKSFKS